jgi:hypothetical protein
MRLQKSLAAVAALALAAHAFAADLTLAWDAVTTNEDGSQLTDLAGYNVYQRTDDTQYDYNTAVASTGSDVTSVTLTNTDNTRRYWVVRAMSADGTESADSNEITVRPSMPLNLRIKLDITVNNATVKTQTQ